MFSELTVFFYKKNCVAGVSASYGGLHFYTGDKPSTRSCLSYSRSYIINLLHEEIYRRTCHFLFASNNACTMSTRWMCFVGGSGRCSAFKHCVHVLLYVSDMHFIFYRSFNIACTCLRAATGKLAAKSSKGHLFLTWNQCCYTRSLTIKKIKLSKRCHTGQHFLAVETVLTYFSCSSVWLVSLGLHLHISMFLTTAFLWRSHGPCHLSHKTLKSKFTKKQNKQKNRNWE